MDNVILLDIFHLSLGIFLSDMFIGIKDIVQIKLDISNKNIWIRPISDLINSFLPQNKKRVWGII